MVVLWIFGGMLINAARAMWQTKTWVKEPKLRVYTNRAAGGLLGLMGVLVIIGSFFAPSIGAQQDKDLDQYTRECTEQGGYVLRLDNNSNECWQTKISEQ